MNCLKEAAHMRATFRLRHRLSSLQPTVLRLRPRPAPLSASAAPVTAPAVAAETMATSATNPELVAEVESLRKQLAALETTLKNKESQLNTVWPYSRSYGRSSINTILGAADGGKSLAGQTLRVGGWVKTGREAGAGAFAFLEVNDGSCFDNMQIMCTKEVAEAVGGLKNLTPTGVSVLIEGQLTETPPGTKQAVELKATAVVHVGECDAKDYPIAKKKTSYEFLRDKMHLRSRTNTIGAVARIRNALAFATHKFFQENGFLYVHTPIITASDCEGAGEMFQVTTLLTKADEAHTSAAPSGPSPVDAATQSVASLKDKVSLLGGQVKEAKAAAAADKADTALAATAKAAVDALLTAKNDLTKAEEELVKAQDASRVVGGLLRTAEGKIDYREDFFGKPSFLTVSGQLQGEYFACALSNVYTFGPTFRAELSYTTRHLAEFWMIEPEIAFCDLKDDMQCAEDYVRYCCRFLLDNCRQDLDFIVKMVDKGAIERLEQVASTPFKRITYTEAIEVLEKAVAGGKKFEYPVSWGIDLATEHERFITEEIYKQPTIVYNYPKDIKAFYMKLNEDGKTVAAMDVLVPKVGELIGGSQREDRYDVLKQRIEAQGMPLEPYEAYLDIRKYGSVPHSGFGLGFERLILFATGLENIREVIPFPRWPGNASC